MTISDTNWHTYATVTSVSIWMVVSVHSTVNIEVYHEKINLVSVMFERLRTGERVELFESSEAVIRYCQGL